MTTCIHDLEVAECAVCTPPTPARLGRVQYGPSDEPSGHRGHPSEEEMERAATIRPALVEVLGELAGAGVERPLEFLAEMARLVALEQDLETWGGRYGPQQTIRNVLLGRAAKSWSLGVLERTVEQVRALLR